GGEIPVALVVVDAAERDSLAVLRVHEADPPEAGPVFLRGEGLVLDGTDAVEGNELDPGRAVLASHSLCDLGVHDLPEGGEELLALLVPEIVDVVGSGLLDRGGCLRGRFAQRSAASRCREA